MYRERVVSCIQAERKPITLVYSETILYVRTSELELLRFTPGRDISSENFFFVFFHWTDSGSLHKPGLSARSQARAQNALSHCSALWLLTDRRLSDCMGLRTSVVIYYTEAYALFLGNSSGISTVPCLH